jgi:hypothetical protein
MANTGRTDNKLSSQNEKEKRRPQAVIRSGSIKQLRALLLSNKAALSYSKHMEKKAKQQQQKKTWRS